jgi:hypothetical protein
MQIVYDTEEYPNCFLFIGKHLDDISVFEISQRRRDNYELWHYISKCTSMIGFNNYHFDWPIVDYFMRNPNTGPEALHALCHDIIFGGNDRRHTIWKPEIEQVDLFLINGFDNPARSTSLKKLEFNMRCRNVANLPFRPGTHLTSDEIDLLIDYGKLDVEATAEFAAHSQVSINLRRAFNRPDWLNKSDIKLGRAYFEDALGKLGVQTHERDALTGRKTARITTRPGGVNLGGVIFPYLQFKSKELTQVRADVAAWTIRDEEKDGKVVRVGATKDYSFTYAGIEVFMGLGGIHACVDPCFIDGSEQEIIDIDVVSFYPSLTIANRIYPEHLGETFCDVYATLLQKRLQTEKGTPENAILKLALNAVFGSSGSKYVCFFDPKYMLSVTINGQLLLLSLLEYLVSKCDGLKILQLNTDGITVLTSPGTGEHVKECANVWAEAVCLKLEFSDYSRMWIRDVNNYIAEHKNGKRKRKGCYEHHRQWHQNQSMPIAALAAEAYMCNGTDIGEYIRLHENTYDFLMRLDMRGETRLVLSNGEEYKGIVRYYVAEDGHAGVKHYGAAKQIRLHAEGHAEPLGKRGAYTCSICDAEFKTKAEFNKHNDAEHASKLCVVQQYAGEKINPDYRFYINEARKLVIE